jgi:putative ABC transport system permease protein
MLRNYIKIAIRNIIRNKIFSLINIVGLSIGVACFILIVLWIKDELSYDRFHNNLEQIYLVYKEYQLGDDISANPSTPYPLAKAAGEQIPEVILSTHYYQGSIPVRYGERMYNEDRVCFTDSSFFRILTFDFLRGNPGSSLSNPNSVVITEKIAHKYFGDIDPVGKSLTLNNRFELLVHGVIANVPSNSEFQFDLFAHIDNITERDDEENWGSHWLYTYLLLDENASTNRVERKLTEIIRDRLPNEKLSLKLQPLKDLHLYSVDGNRAGMKYVLFFSVIGVFILLIACINYMNLSTARSSKRELEIGIRKTAGAFRRHLIFQFIVEAFLFSILSFLIALIIVELCRPAFNNLTGKNLVISYFKPDFFLTLFILLLFTGFLAGSYPALALSKFKPLDTFHGTTGFTLKNAIFRKGLVILQFVITITLISGTGIILLQLRYIQTTDLGYEPENLLYLPMNPDIKSNVHTIKEELLKHPGIASVAASSQLPGEVWNIMRGIVWEGKETDDGAAFGVLSIDEDYFSTVQTNLISGRNFQSNFPADSISVILNEKAIQVMGMKSPVGGKFDIGDDFLYTIIGITRDFHSLPMNYKIEPVVMLNDPDYYQRVLVRIDPDQITSVLPYIEELWKKIAPNNPFEYHFLDERFERIYRSEIRAGKIFGSFVILAIIISTLGLFGLTSFITAQRTKEIGIRKVCGAKLSEIMFMLSKEITQWVLIAIVIATPITWFVMRKWLQNFEYRAELSWWIFVLAGLSALIIALLTVSYQSYCAGARNPVDSLRYE